MMAKKVVEETAEKKTKSTPAQAGLVAAKNSCLAHAAEGASISETADALGVSRQTIYRWLAQDALFSKAWNETREVGMKLKLYSVEDALYMRCLGVTVEQAGEKRELPADVQAIKLWLGAHCPEKYAQKNNVTLDGNLAASVSIVKLPDNLRHELETCDSE